MKQLLNFDNIAVISHVRPDGDTIGSGLAIYFALTALGKKVDLLCDSELPNSIRFLPESDKYSSENTIKKYNAVIALDCGDINRMGKYISVFNKCPETFNIDHHKSNNSFGKYNLIKPLYSSTCEIIFDLFKEWGIEINYNIAVALYSGLYTDTGGFSHSNATAKVHIMASELIAYGLDVATLAFKLYKEKSLEKTKLTERVIRTLKLHLDGQLAMITINKKDIAETNCPDNDVEGFIDIATNIKGTLAAISILEFDKNVYKVGFRSKTDAIDVSLAAGVFGGGGHIRASGCMISGYYEDVVDRLIKSISDML